MAGATLPRYDAMDNHALSHICKSRGLEVPKGTLKHKLIELLARDHLKEYFRALETQNFDATNDPEGSRRATSILESRRVEKHFSRLELQSLADYNRKQSQMFKDEQDKAERKLEQKINNISLYWDASLNDVTVKVKAEKQLKATAQGNTNSSDSVENNLRNVDDLFEPGPESDTENNLTNVDDLFEPGPESEAENELPNVDYLFESSPEDNGVIGGGDIGEVIEISQKRAKPENESDEEDEHNTTSSKRQRVLDLGGLSEELVKSLTKNPETNDEIQPFLIPKGTIGEKLRGENLMIMELIYEDPEACFPLSELRHYREHFEQFGPLLLMADNSALHVIFQCSEKGENNLIKCMNHVNEQIRGFQFFTLRPCCRYFSKISNYRFGTYVRDAEMDEFELEEEPSFFHCGTSEDELEIDLKVQLDDEQKLEASVDDNEDADDEDDGEHESQHKRERKREHESEDADNEDSDHESEAETFPPSVSPKPSLAPAVVWHPLEEGSVESEEDPDDEPEELQEDADDEFEGRKKSEKELEEELEKELEKELEEGSVERDVEPEEPEESEESEEE